MIQANGVAARTQKLKVNMKASSSCWLGEEVVATGTVFKVGIAKAISSPC